MRIIRPDQSWCILLSPRGERLCLQRLAMRKGYRIGELCSELDCGERYLRQVFIRDIGLSPKEWMRRERMVVARRMLVGGKSPAEVAADLGFSTQNNFRREFLAFYRVLPLRFQLERWGHVDCRIRDDSPPSAET
jgi:AraC-like DNA-binding protein